MQRVRQISEVPKTDKPIVLAMGCFDGVHVGHQKVISTAVEQAAERGGDAWVFTFDPQVSYQVTIGYQGCGNGSSGPAYWRNRHR